MTHIKILDGMETEEFYGNFILSWNFILLSLGDIYIIWLGIGVLRAPDSGFGIAALAILFFMAAFSLVLGGQLCYFRLNDDYLEIRNHIFRFFRKKYRLAAIKSVTIDRSAQRLSRSLRVKSSESRPWSYFAGSLRDEDWHDLDKALRKKGVAVDNKLLTI